MTTLISDVISTTPHTLRWKRANKKPQSRPPNKGNTRRSKRACTHIYVAFFPVTAVLFTLLFGFWGPGGTSSCKDQRLWHVGQYWDYDPWPLSQLLTIDLGFGTMAFSTAKIIDVLWDVVVGRGVQALLTYVAYRVFMKSLTRAMEGCPVPYHTFAAFAFEPGTAAGMFMLAKNFASNRSIRSRMTVSWVLIATLYIVAFPTLSSAMTGYTSVMESYVEDKSVNLVPVWSYKQVAYIIEDGDRIPGFERRTPVVRDTGSDDLVRAVYQYSKLYGFRTTMRNISSIFNISSHSYPLGSPLLNISGGYDAYIYQNDTSFIYDAGWLSDHASCQPKVSTYHWGFSFLLTFIVCVLTTVWSIGMYAMWMDTHQNSRVDRSGRELGGMFRSVMDLAIAIRGDLGEAADLCSNTELGKRLKGSKGGVNLPSDELPLSRMEERRLRRRNKRRQVDSEELMSQVDQEVHPTTNYSRLT